MNQVLLNETPGFGYSCMTMVDDNTVGILYEGVKELFFQKIQVSEILRDY
jgi:sialidase-1